MTAHFDPAVYAELAPEARLYALGLLPPQRVLRPFEELGRDLRAKPGLIKGKLDEVSATKRRFDREHHDRPFTATPAGRALFARYDVLQKLAAYIDAPAAPKPPRGITRLVRL